MFEDNEPIPEKPADLERMSVEDLKERIASLEAEIEACRAEMERKEKHKSAADALFGKDH